MKFYQYTIFLFIKQIEIKKSIVLLLEICFELYANHNFNDYFNYVKKNKHYVYEKNKS